MTAVRLIRVLPITIAIRSRDALIHPPGDSLPSVSERSLTLIVILWSIWASRR
jgi:hypothetical protein